MRGLRRADIVVAGGAVAVVLFIALLPSPRDNNPPIPDTPEHRARPPGRPCLGCHGPSGLRPLPAPHPARRDCLRCHREPAAGPVEDTARPDRTQAGSQRHARHADQQNRPWKETRRW